MPAVELPDTPVSGGFGRVVLESVDGRAEVFAVWAGPLDEPTHQVPTQQPRQFNGRICLTPCTADLPLGRYDIYFTARFGTEVRGDAALLTVHRGLNVHRRALGAGTPPSDDDRSAGYALAALGSTGLAAGAGLTLGAAVTGGEQVSMAAGVVTLVIGAVTALVGGIVLDRARATERAGASTTWVEPLPSAAPPSSMPTAAAVDLEAGATPAPEAKSPARWNDSARAGEGER